MESVSWAPGMASAAGAPGTGTNATELSKAITLAESSDVAILVLGDIQGLHNGGCGEWGDRDDLDLQGGQLELLRAVTAVAKKTIVFLVHGRPATFGPDNSALDGVGALFAAWRPGEEFGNAAVNVMMGRTNPSAKLSQSWPRSVGQVGGGASPWLQTVRGKWIANNKGDVDPLDGRRYDTYASSASKLATPLFYFGYGLSYTTFAYRSLSVVPVAVPAEHNTATEITDVGQPLWQAHVEVSNVGSVAGTEIVQVYVKDPAGLPFVPFWKRLVGFGRIHLLPGQTATLTITVKSDDVALYADPETSQCDENGGVRSLDPVLILFPGEYMVTAGGASNDATVSATVKI